MVLINTYNSNLFTYNGVRLVRNFIPLKAGSASITIINAYDSKYQLMGSTHYSNISVNGTVYSNQTDLMNALSPILFVKQTAENSFSGNYNDLVGIPSEFNPSPHTHEIEDINGLDTLLNPDLQTVLGNGNSSEIGMSILNNSIEFLSETSTITLSPTTFNLDSEDLSNVSIQENDIRLSAGFDQGFSGVIGMGKSYKTFFPSTEPNYALFREVGSGFRSNLFFEDPTGWGNFILPDIGNNTEIIATQEWVVNNPYYPSLQDVTDQGNLTTEDIFVNTLFIKDLGTSGYANINFNTGAFYVQDNDFFYQFICDGSVGALAVGRNSDNVYFSIKSDLLTASRDLFIPNESGIIATREWFSANTINPTLQQVLDAGDSAIGSNIILSDGFNKTAVFGGDEVRLVDVSTNETLYLHHNNIQFLGEDGITDLVFENPTSSNVLTFPDKTGTLATLDDIGGGLESLSGDGVDNTDPLNPVLTYPTPDDIGAENALGFTPEDVNNKAVDFSIVDDTLYPSVQAVKNELDLLENRTVSTTGTTIFFATPQVYNLPTSGITGNITNDLTGARIGVIQKIYHQDSTEPTIPMGWVLLGGEYKINELNIIYAEFAGSSRVEYWIANEI